MNRSGPQRFIPIILIIIVVVVAIAALISLGRSIFGGSGEEKVPDVNVGQQSLLNTAIDRSVRLTVRGPIVANEDFHSYTITASPTARNMTIYNGYLDEQVESKDLPNNTRAYEQFVFALDRANMMKGSVPTGETNDRRGLCATGRVYEYEVLQASNSIKKLWTTTCSGSKGSLDASNQQLLRLFQVQIPEFSTLARKEKL